MDWWPSKFLKSDAENQRTARKRNFCSKIFSWIFRCYLLVKWPSYVTSWLILILFDCKDSFKTAEWIRKLEADFWDSWQDETAKLQQSHMPIIALTASDMDEYEQMCMAKGMTCFLTKPIKKETLVHTLASVMTNSSSASFCL